MAISLPSATGIGMASWPQLGSTRSGKRVIPKRILPAKSVVTLVSAATAISHLFEFPSAFVIEHERSRTMSMFGGMALATISWAIQPPGTHAFIATSQMVPGPQSPSVAHVPGSMQTLALLQICGSVHAGLHPKVPPVAPLPEPPPPVVVVLPPLGCDAPPVSDEPHEPVNTAAS